MYGKTKKSSGGNIGKQTMKSICPKCGSENTRIVYTCFANDITVGIQPHDEGYTRKQCLHCDYWWNEYKKKGQQ